MHTDKCNRRKGASLRERDNGREKQNDIGLDFSGLECGTILRQPCSGVVKGCSNPPSLLSFLTRFAKQIFVQCGGGVADLNREEGLSLCAQFLKRMITPDLDFALIFSRLREIVGKLHPQPRFRRAAKCLGETDRHLRADPRLSVQNVI